MARATVFRYKGRTSEAQAIGQTLGVSAILTGRVVERQKNLMVTAELIDPANGWQLWGSQFHRNSADLLALEENIANEISGALRSKLSGVSDATPRPQTENVEAHRLYLKGRYYWGKRTEEALKKAIQHFHKAIDLDPGYARAYAGLSEGFVPLAFYGHVAPRDALAKARSAAEKALELDPDSAEAWTVLGSVRGILDWDEAGAVDVIRKAIALDPNYSRARQSLGERYMALGNPEEAVIEMQRALELDPLSLSLHAAVGMAQFYAGRYDEAIEICRKAVDMDPTFYPARWQLALCLTEKADFEQAVGELKEASELSKESMNIRASLAAALAGWGRLDDAREVLGQMEQMRKRRYVSGTLVASVHMRLEDSGGALVELERAVEERCCWVRYLRIDPRFQELSQDPRLQELLSRMGTSPPQGVSP
jgi:serine/threonine-protein kinase